MRNWFRSAASFLTLVGALTLLVPAIGCSDKDATDLEGGTEGGADEGAGHEEAAANQSEIPEGEQPVQ